ncbi:MAG: DUF342 domain-containing protein [Clostridiales bacterium]|nr:DUF342 domain-containing protein [Clostridiales bacterium]
MRSENGNTIETRITPDGLYAFLKIETQSDEPVTMDQIREELDAKQIVYGVDWAFIESIVKDKRYFLEFQIAKGTESQDGKDGYYEYLFDVDVDVKPKILKDGSVDYKSMGEVPVVKENQEIVRYHPATEAKNGKNVRGEEIIGRNGKDLQTLKGKGFIVSEDKTLYYAAITGKAIAKGRTLKVSSLLEINGDVSISTGGVNFTGDVVIHGNVLSGTQVNVQGDIEVNGCVEAATLIAGKNVVLKNGMQGNGKGIIRAGGNVSGKFFEQVSIEAKGNVSANAIMNCDIQCGDTIQVAGRFGIIVGGKVSALREIEATIIGNMAGTKTCLEAGTKEDLFVKMQQLEHQCKEISMETAKYSNALKKMTEIMEQQDLTPELQKKKMMIMRLKIEKEATLSDLEKQKTQLAEKIGKCSNARIIVVKSIYPGVILTINGITERIKTENYNSTYQKKGYEIGFTSNI